MRVLVTGACGFAGRWLIRELESAGHVAIPAPRGTSEDLWNVRVVRENLVSTQPDAVAHLAAVSFGPDATADPELAVRTNAGGTQALIDALASVDRRICLLVTGSSEVYGVPDPANLPLRKDAPLRTTAPYGLSKLAQESVAVEGAVQHGIPTAVTRAFNHTGPGQRPVFAAPAFARRVLSVQAGRATTIPAGNVDVRRDLGDVRDVVVAYRFLSSCSSAEMWRVRSSPTSRPVAPSRCARLSTSCLGRPASMRPSKWIQRSSGRAIRARSAAMPRSCTV